MGECVREHEMREANTGPFEGKTIARLTIYEYLFQKGLAFLLADPSRTAKSNLEAAVGVTGVEGDCSASMARKFFTNSAISL